MEGFEGRPYLAASLAVDLENTPFNEPDKELVIDADVAVTEGTDVDIITEVRGHTIAMAYPEFDFTIPSDLWGFPDGVVFGSCDDSSFPTIRHGFRSGCDSGSVSIRQVCLDLFNIGSFSINQIKTARLIQFEGSIVKPGSSYLRAMHAECLHSAKPFVVNLATKPHFSIVWSCANRFERTNS